MISVAYGEHPAQVAELWPPAGRARGVAVLVHGGFWRARYDASLQHDLAADLVARGWAVWNLDYRAVGHGHRDGGGWPQTFVDVAAGMDALAGVAVEHRLPLSTVITVGHSAGGTLALWAAARHRLPPGSPGGPPRLRPTAVVAQAAVCDLAAGARDRLGAGAVQALMGPAADYGRASPAELLPIGVPMLVVTGEDDDTVPPEQSRRFVAAAREAGDAAELVVVPGEGHYAHLEDGSTSWRLAVEWMAASARMAT